MEVKIDADNSEYLAQLQAEKDNLDSSFSNAEKLINDEMSRIQSGGNKKEDALIDVLKEKNVKKSEKIIIPTKEYPKFNFVGKLLGPKGSSLKRLQEDTQTKMSILGRGSMKDKRKEEELRKEGGKYEHLNHELHVLVEVFAPPAECHSRLAHALFELKKYMNPSQTDDIYQQQLEEIMYTQGGEGPGGAMPAMGGPGPGMSGRGRGGMGVMGRGAPGRGAPRGASGRGGPAGGRGGASLGMPPPPIPSLRGAPTRGGMPGSRGAPRGAPRGAGSMRGAAAQRGAPAPRSLVPPPMSRPVAPPVDFQDESYGYEEAYPEQNYQDPQSLLEQPEAQYFDYGHQTAQATEDYHQDDGYGASVGYGESTMSTMSRPTSRGGFGGKPGSMSRKEDAWANGSSGLGAGYGKLAAPRGRGEGRAHPYNRGGMQRY